MGNGFVKLVPCFHGGSAAAMTSEPLDEGLGHSFVYVRPDVPHLSRSGSNACSSSRIHHSDEAVVTTTTFRSISGAAVSANAATPLSTAPLILINDLACSSPASFESSSSFASTLLQPRHSASLSGSDRHFFHCGHLDRGFYSAPLEHHRASGVFSGPLDRLSSSSGHMYRSLSHRLALRRAARHRRTAPALIGRVTKAISRAATSLGRIASPCKPSNKPNVAKVPNFIPNLDLTADPSSNSTTINSSGNDQTSFDYVGDESDSFDATNGNFHWAQGKAGEDRVHVVVSEEHGWVFVGIYDGFNGPDATDYLLTNLYEAVHRELKGLLWYDLQNACEPSRDTSQELEDDGCYEEGKQSCSCGTKRREGNVECDAEGSEINRRLKEQVIQSSSGAAVDHRAVLKALSRALRKTEEAYLRMTDMMVSANPELALMGSCALVMLMRGEDVYLLNVGDSRTVLARRAESDLWNLVGQATQDLEAIRNQTLRYLESCDDGELVALQLTLDHSTCNNEEVRRIRNEHPDDPCAIVNNRVKGSLKVTRAFGAGYLKQPKWNNALLGAFKIDYKGSSPYITCNPFLCYHRLGPKDKYLILSSDGLYQYFTNEEMVTQVELYIATNPEGDPAQYLVEEVLYRAANKAGMDFNQLLEVPQGDRRRYHDDVSIIIISLEGRMWRSSCV